LDIEGLSDERDPELLHLDKVKYGEFYHIYRRKAKRAREQVKVVQRTNTAETLLLLNKHDFVPANQVKSISLHIASYRLLLIRLG
jgi:hypothetical protein